MRRTLVGLVALALVAAPLAGPVSAKKAKSTTFFLHGTQPAGELEMFEHVLNSTTMKMDTTKPEGAPKSMFVSNWVVSPNDQCSGNPLFPFWVGEFAGKFKGDVKVSLHTIASPGAEVSVELFVDPTGGCTSDLAGTQDFVDPVAEKIVPVAPGHALTNIKFKKMKFQTEATIGLQVHMAKLPENPTGEQPFVPAQVRILYDSADLASAVQLVGK